MEIQEKKGRKNHNQGITLIALVISIIVILILAGVTIATLTGENGILSRAQDTNGTNAYYSAEEQVKLVYMAVKTEIMAKTVDKNGFWFIPHNPISKVGIFDYLGSSISEECEPNKVYKVFRPGDTLLASVPTWDNPPKPFINDHEMLGEGFSKIDDRPVQGVISNPQYEDGVLYADITVYSEALKDSIENGKKELSLGYFCKFEKQPGTYEGENYDYVQTNMVGNHIALVDAGRCGSDVKVFDRKWVMDSFDIISKDEDLKKTEDPANINDEQETETKDDAMADKREAIRKIMAIAAKPDSDFEGGEKEKIETIAKLLEESEYAKSEKGTANDEEAKKDDGEEKAEDSSVF